MQSGRGRKGEVESNGDGKGARKQWTEAERENLVLRKEEKELFVFLFFFNVAKKFLWFYKLHGSKILDLTPNRPVENL